MTEGYNKLVRDKIPEHLDSRGISYKQRVASSEEYRAELIKKLEEELREFLETETVEELADLLEVIEALKNYPNLQTWKKPE